MSESWIITGLMSVLVHREHISEVLEGLIGEQFLTLPGELGSMGFWRKEASSLGIEWEMRKQQRRASSTVLCISNTSGSTGCWYSACPSSKDIVPTYGGPEEGGRAKLAGWKRGHGHGGGLGSAHSHGLGSVHRSVLHNTHTDLAWGYPEAGQPLCVWAACCVDDSPGVPGSASWLCFLGPHRRPNRRAIGELDLNTQFALSMVFSSTMDSAAQDSLSCWKWIRDSFLFGFFLWLPFGCRIWEWWAFDCALAKWLGRIGCAGCWQNDHPIVWVGEVAFFSCWFTVQAASQWLRGKRLKAGAFNH